MPLHWLKSWRKRQRSKRKSLCNQNLNSSVRSIALESFEDRRLLAIDLTGLPTGKPRHTENQDTQTFFTEGKPRHTNFF